MLTANGWDFETALHMPLMRVFPIINCIRKRNGGRFGGPDYYERIQLQRDRLRYGTRH